MKNIDIAIIGAGPAGLMSAVFASRQGMNVAVFNSQEQLSNLALAHAVGNHPGEMSIPGIELLQKIRDQVENMKINIIDEKVVSIEKKRSEFSIKTSSNSEYVSSAIIIATGQVNRKAGVPGEEKFSGKGVSYCALCDGPLFKNKKVVVIGGGDTAVTSAIALKEMGIRELTIIHRRNEFRAEKANIQRMEKLGIHKITDVIIDEIIGDKFVKKIRIKNIKTEKTSEIDTDAVFIEIGYVPTTEITKDLNLTVDKDGFIRANSKRETNTEGVFVAGDVTNSQYKILVGAYSDGAVAGINAAEFVSKSRGMKFMPNIYFNI
ncbi:MAG: FAD-dependent oxidoreductase [Candidatus Aenigmatarchaeota archaeon]